MPDPKEPVKEPKKTATELINSKLEDLTKDEIELRITYIRAMAEEAKLEDTKNNLDDRRNKLNMRREKLIANGRELTKTARDQELVQNICVHRKGGRGGVPGGLLKGTDVNYSLIKHILPQNEMWIRCSRCGKTWKPVFRENYAVGLEGDALFNTAKEAYKWAVDANTDNQTSSSITFTHTSADDNKSAKAFVREVMKDVTLR
jgi:hypothetical protein